jgi:hypothetical protein
MVLEGGRYKVVKLSHERLRQVPHLLNSKSLTNEELHYRIISLFTLVKTSFGYRYLTWGDFQEVTTVLTYSIFESINALYGFGDEILEGAYRKQMAITELTEKFGNEKALLDKSLESLGVTRWTCDIAKLPRPILELWEKVAELQSALSEVTPSTEDTDMDVAKLRPYLIDFANRIVGDLNKLLLKLLRLLYQLAGKQIKVFLRDVVNEHPPPIPITIRPQIQPRSPNFAA